MTEPTLAADTVPDGRARTSRSASCASSSARRSCPTTTRVRSGSAAGCSTGNGDPVPDGMVEIWQANAAGRYAHSG